jgi:hypothetical protein
MLHLSALALGPLLARAAPNISSGNVDISTAISRWLAERFADPTGKLARVLTRIADRAWLSLEIALAGEDLHRSAVVAGVDRALVEQIRQFIEVASLPTSTLEQRRDVRVALQNARKADRIPGPVPTANALAAMIIRYFGAADESTEIDNNLLTELSLKLHIAGYSTLSGFIGLRSTDRHSLLITSVRFFLSREIAEDLRLLRDLRYTRIELLPDAVRAGFDRLADAFDRFTPVIVELLSELTVSTDANAEQTTVVAPDAPKIDEPGFYILGEHLIAPIRTVADGSRIAPCPVCMTQTIIRSSDVAWVSLRCSSCGTEFQATDGTAPPPSPPVPKSEATSKSRQRAKNLQLWIDSGGPIRWIEYHKGIWSETEYYKLIDVLRASRFWPLDLTDVHRILTEMIAQYKTRVTLWGGIPAGATESPRSSTSRGLVRASGIYRTIDGNSWIPCPLCRSFNVEIPPGSSGEISLTCSGCLRTFLVDLKKATSAVFPPPAPPSPPSFWGKIRKWFNK